MPTLAGQRARFTLALNQYNLAEDTETREPFVGRMAECIDDAPKNGFTVEQVTQGQLYPAAAVERYREQNLRKLGNGESGPNEGEALREVAEAVDTKDVLRLGDGPNIVYAYGYSCAPDRLKVGLTEGDAVERIAAQISTGTPDKPVLLLEIRTHDCGSLERAIHATLAYRGKKITGGGKEWFKTTREEVVTIYQAVANAS